MKDTRVNIRLPQAEKQHWEETAAQYGMTTTEFVTRSVRNTIAALERQASGNRSSTTGNPTVVFTNWSASSGFDA